MKYAVLVICCFIVVLFSRASAEAGLRLSGYERMSWDASIRSVMTRYPRGQLGRLGEEYFYRQYRPNVQLARRNFAFSKGKLHTVTHTYDRHFVEKLGVERLLQEYSRRYGDAAMDTSQAPYMISCRWQSDDTRITLTYAPKRPDLTVVIFEKVR